MLTKGTCLLADNAPSHSSQVAVDKAKACVFEILQHLSYSPDLAPNDFFLFPEMKNPLWGRQFNNTDDDINEVEE